MPVAIGGPGLQANISVGGPPEAGLANVTATILNLMGFDAPSDYEASLIRIN